MWGEGVELIVRSHHTDGMPPYERLLGDAMRGDPMIFVRQDAVEAAWEVVDPILGKVSPVYQYAPDTWGPPEADRIIERLGGWHNPVLTEPVSVFGPHKHV
jgi:glucose-6-phosphate 1-dehydrogenase